LAGPGSGKTEVLTLLVLRLLYVENDPAQSERIQPEAILVRLLAGLFPLEAELTKAISEYHIWSAPLMLIA
jgi:hypothetical protein